MSAVTEDGSGLSVRQTPRKRAYARDQGLHHDGAGTRQSAAVRVFTDAERFDADTYAADTGGTVVPLPLPTSAELSHTGGGDEIAVEGQQVGLDLWPREHDLSATLGWTTRGVGRLERHRRRD